MAGDLCHLSLISLDSVHARREEEEGLAYAG